jgi:hypothetical protein
MRKWRQKNEKLAHRHWAKEEVYALSEFERTRIRLILFTYWYDSNTFKLTNIIDVLKSMKNFPRGSRLFALFYGFHMVFYDGENEFF